MNLCANLFQPDTQGLYTDICGYSHALYEQYTHCSKIVHDQILQILNKCDISYFLFAGSMVGYVRDKKMPAWMDDLDIMIFEKDIEKFWGVAAIKLRECGFNCRAVDKPFEGAGAHILAMQLGNRRDHQIPLTAGVSKSVPWAQVDVFFSKVTDDGLIKNLKGWGLYHYKNVPADLVFPKRMIEIDERIYPAFNNIEKDIFLEYGDVLNNIVVQTHDKVFLRARDIPWEKFNADWREYIAETSSRLTVGIDVDKVTNHNYVTGQTFTAEQTMSFSDIVEGIVTSRASSVYVLGEFQLLFCSDLKRIFPQLQVGVWVNSARYANHAAHLRRYIDFVQIENEDVKNHYNQIIHALEELVPWEKSK